MATATKRPDTDCTHRKSIKCKKIEKKKKLQEENDKIDHILRSPEYTEADKARHFQQRGRNLKEILKLSKEINEIDNGLLSPGGSCPNKSGRSQTRGPYRRYASQSPIQRSPRSASSSHQRTPNDLEHRDEYQQLKEELSRTETELENTKQSSLPRRRGDQTDEDNLRKMQDQLEQSRKENELLRGELSEERHKGQKIASKLQEEYEVVIFDLKLEITNQTEELKEKEAALTKLEKVDIPHLQKERDEWKASAAQIKQRLRQEMNMELEESELRSRQKVAEVEEILQAYKVENEKLRNENSETMEQYQSLRIFFSQRRDYYNEVAEKAEENTAILHERLKTEVEEKERIQRDNITLKTQIDSSSRGHEKNPKNTLEKLGKLQKENDRLKEKLELIQNAYQRECGNVTTLQQKETEMRQKISEIKRRNQYLENEMKEEKDSISTKREREKEIIRLHSVVRDKDLVEVKLRNAIEDLEKKFNEIQSRTDKRPLRIEEKGREQLKQNSDKELNRLRQLEINNKIEKESLKSNYTDLEKKVKQLQDEKEILLQNEKSERKIADRLKSELDAEKRDSNKLRDKMRDLERESLLSIEKIETGRKQVLDEMDRKLIRLRRSENDYKNKADNLKSELTDLRRDFALLQQEKDELIESVKAEMKKEKDVQKELNDARIEEVKFRDRIKELERQMMTVPKVDPSMSAENSRLKEDLKHLGIELKNAQQRLTQLEINNKIEAASHTSNQTALEKKVKQLQDEKEKLLQNEEMKRKLAEKIKSESGDRDLERERLRRLQSVYKNETDTLKHELADLTKKTELLQEEKEKLVESEATERQIAETVQNELDDAKREILMLRNRIKELQRQMNTFPKVDSSMAEENSGLKEDLKHLGIELQKAQQNYKKKEESLVKNVNRLRKENDGLVQNGNREREEAEKLKTELDATKTDLKKFQDRIRDLERKGATSVDKKDESDSLTLTLSEAVKEFQGIFKKEWKEAARALSNNRVLESQIWQKLYEILKICLCGTNTECTDMTKSLKRFRYFKSDHNLQKETVMKMACVATAVPTKTKEILEMISTGNHHVPNSAPDAVKTSPSKDEEHEKYSDIEGSVIRIVDKQDTESGNPSASVGTSPIGMACSVTNYDLTSDFLKSCSIKAQKE